MANGEGREADDLNRITKGYLTEHEEDVADAQVRCDAITGNIYSIFILVLYKSSGLLSRKQGNNIQVRSLVDW